MKRSMGRRRIGLNDSLKIKTWRCLETWGSNYLLKQRHIPEEGNPQLHCCGKLKTRDWCCSCRDDDCEYFNDNGENGECDRDVFVVVGGGGDDDDYVDDGDVDGD